MCVHIIISFLYNIRNVPALDEFGGLSDPFVKCYFRNGKEGKDVKFYATETVNNVEAASWDEPITFDNYQMGTNQVNCPDLFPQCPAVQY